MSRLFWYLLYSENHIKCFLVETRHVDNDSHHEHDSRFNHKAEHRFFMLFLKYHVSAERMIHLRNKTSKYFWRYQCGYKDSFMAKESRIIASFNSSFSVQNPRALTSFLESVGVLLFAFLGPCLPLMLVILSGEQLHRR